MAKSIKAHYGLKYFLMEGLNSDPEQVKEIAKYAQQSKYLMRLECI